MRNVVRQDEYGGECILSLKKDQNSEECLDLLAAQRVLYREAKNLWKLYGVSVIVLSLVSLIITLLLPQYKANVAMGSFTLALLNIFIFKKSIEHKVQQAATIQEEFDTEVFGLNWNKHIVGKRVRKELICEKSTRLSMSERAKLRDWYPDVGESEYPKSVLICQRTNLYWDFELRKKYGYLVIGITILIIFITFITMWILNKSFIDSFVSFIIPISSILFLGFETGIGNLKLAEKKEKYSGEIESIIGLPGTSLEECRQIQDKIFIMRNSSSLVIESMYNWLKERFEENTRKTLKKL